MSVKRLLSALFCSLLLMAVSVINAYAEENLPNGAVKGMPDRVIAVDSDGDPINSDTGEYFFSVEDMKPGVHYTKDIQLMNLREDKGYHLFFYPESVSKNGSIDLEKDCDCTFYLDDEVIYTGSVTGNSENDALHDIIDLGSYAPGESHKLVCDIVWNTRTVVQPEDIRTETKKTKYTYSKRVYGKSKGEIEFKWVFCAAVNEEYDPPETGILHADGGIWLYTMCGAAGMTVIMLFMIFMKKRKQADK